MSFWDAIEAYIAELDEEDGAPDPWGGVDVEAGDLTEAQRAYLAGFEDQPPVPRIEGETPPGE